MKNFFKYIQELEDFYNEDEDKFKSIYKLGINKWKSYVIGGLVVLGFFDKESYDKGYLKFSDYGIRYVEDKDIYIIFHTTKCFIKFESCFEYLILNIPFDGCI